MDGGERDGCSLERTEEQAFGRGGILLALWPVVWMTEVRLHTSGCVAYSRR